MKLNLKLVTVLFMAFIIGLPVLAQNNAKIVGGVGIITGIIKDSITGQPIEYATVTLLRQKDSVAVVVSASNGKGEFVVENIPPGSYLVKTTYIGYNKHFQDNIKIASNNLNLGEIKLAPAVVASNEVSVTAEKEMVTYKLDKKIVNASQIMSAAGGTAVDLLQNVPGVTVDIEGNVAIRGSSSFVLLVDGRPTLVSANQLLKQIPASAIENIEIITNPSAKYDPDGTSGILNLVMKKESMSGINGLISGSVGTRDKYNGNFLMNYKNDNVNYNISCDGNNMKYYPTSNFTRQTYQGDSTLLVNSVADRFMNSKGYNLKGGIDYKINDKNALTFSTNYGYYGFDRIFPNKNDQSWEPNKFHSYYTSRDVFLISGDYTSLALNHQYLFAEKGHELNTNASMGFVTGKIDDLFRMYNTDNNFNIIDNTLNQHQSFDDTKRREFKGKIDYSKPLGASSKMEAGGECELYHSEGDFRYNDFDPVNKIWKTNTMFTNKSSLGQNVFGVYATYADELFGFQYQLGLRTEYYKRNYEQKLLDKTYVLESVDWFPTFHMSKELPNDNQILASYSRRINRPDDRLLNPFPDYADDYYVSAGNPLLKPEYIDSYEFSYRKGFSQSFVSAELFYKQTNGLISRVSELRSDNRVWLLYGNVDKDYSYGLELAANISIAKWLRINATASVFNYNLVLDNAGTSKTSNKNVINGNLTPTFMFSASTIMQLQVAYQGPRITADGDMDAVSVLGFTLRHEMFNKALTISLRGQDVLKTAKYQFTSNKSNYSSWGYFLPESQAFTLTFSYRINNYKPDQRRPDSSAPSVPGFGGGY